MSGLAIMADHIIDIHTGTEAPTTTAEEYTAPGIIVPDAGTIIDPRAMPGFAKGQFHWSPLPKCSFRSAKRGRRER
jgi:hypothetical protein